jgi:hypothetical protein
VWWCTPHAASAGGRKGRVLSFASQQISDQLLAMKIIAAHASNPTVIGSFVL